MSKYQLLTGKKLVKDIFSKDNFYNIPDYQRPYVWTDENVIDLLEDIYQAYINNENKEYFIGCMIWNEKNSVNEDYKVNDILDGQQRFLTLFILHAVFRDISNEQKIITKSQERLKQDGDELDGIPERERITFDIRNDSEFLKNYIYEYKGTLKNTELKKIINNGNSVSSKNMANAIIVMHKWFMDVNFESAGFTSFFKYLSNKVISIYLATPDSLDDAYNLFTVLNSRGVKLQMSDILRAQNLRLIKDKSIREMYAEDWDKYINTVSKPYSSFDDFLYHIVYIIMKYSSDDNENLKKSFDFLHNKKILNKGSDTFELIEKYVKHYDEIINKKLDLGMDTVIFNNIVYILNSTFVSQYLMPLLQYKEFFGTNGICRYLIKLENLMTMNWLLGKRSIQTRLFILMRRVEYIGNLYKKTNNENLIEQVINCKELKYDFEIGTASTYLNSNELFDMFNNEKWGAYGGSKVNKIRYLLLKLDLINGNNQNVLHFNKNQSSIEHLLPRSYKNTDFSVSNEEHEEWLHKLGNIVMLDRKKNSSMSNSCYNIKKEKYKKDIENRNNTNSVFMKYDYWDINTIKDNHKRVVSQLINYYTINDITSLH